MIVCLHGNSYFSYQTHSRDVVKRGGGHLGPSPPPLTARIKKKYGKIFGLEIYVYYLIYVEIYGPTCADSDYEHELLKFFLLPNTNIRAQIEVIILLTQCFLLCRTYHICVSTVSELNVFN